MRALLSFLLCFVFLESQALAVHTRGSGIGLVDTVVGTYSGVLLPPGSPFLSGFTTEDTNTSSSTTSTTTDLNSLAVFNLAVPDTGLSTGSFLAFSNGQTFVGTIDGLADPDTANILAVLQGTFTFSLPVTTTSTTASSSTTTATTLDITATATGSMNATILPPLVGVATSTPALARLTGTAHLDVNFGNVDPTTFAPVIVSSLDFIVIGFKQSAIAAASGGGGGAGGGAAISF